MNWEIGILSPELRLCNNGEAIRKKVWSAGRPSEFSERLERIVKTIPATLLPVLLLHA
jgi:hypothetical protein